MSSLYKLTELAAKLGVSVAHLRLASKSLPADGVISFTRELGEIVHERDFSALAKALAETPPPTKQKKRVRYGAHVGLSNGRGPRGIGGGWL